MTLFNVTLVIIVLKQCSSSNGTLESGFGMLTYLKDKKEKNKKKLAIVLFIYPAKFRCFHSNLSARVSFHLIAMSNLQRPEAFLNRLSEQ